jgi:hypothetical protein
MDEDIPLINRIEIRIRLIRAHCYKKKFSLATYCLPSNRQSNFELPGDRVKIHHTSIHFHSPGSANKFWYGTIYIAVQL